MLDSSIKMTCRTGSQNKSKVSNHLCLRDCSRKPKPFYDD